MLKFNPAPFRPPFWLSNPHVQSILPKFIAKPPPYYRRELVMDSFAQTEVAYDFYDAETHLNPEINSSGKYTTPVLVLFHGLEGGSDSHYASTLAHQTHTQGWNFVVPHYRSCGGIPAKGDIFYNAGDTTELHHVLTNLSKEYTTIYAIGVSLGGNMLAKYMGEYGEKAVCQAAVIASAPVDLSSSSSAMERFFGKYIYTPYLLNPLVKKALISNLPQHELDAIKSSKMISDFDHVFTAPRHGFRSVNEYYDKASALPYLKDIIKPTLIITAKDDPFLGMTAKKEDVSDAVTLLDTKHGGHIGFMQWVANAEGKNKFNLTWLPDTSIEFFNTCYGH